MKDKRTPRKICESCANGLILANIFRLKVIESNGKCRELLKWLQKDKQDNSQEDIIERLQKNVGKVNTKRRDRFSQDPASVLKVEVEDYDDNNGTGFTDNVSVASEEDEAKVTNVLETETEKICVVCAEPMKEKVPLLHFRQVLNKILPLKETEIPDSICPDCMEVTKEAERLFAIRDQVRNMKQEVESKKDVSLSEECQFCSINDVFSTRTPKYLVHKFNLMPVCRENEENKIHSESKSCKGCMKLLKQVYLLVTQYCKGQKTLEDALKVPVIKEKRSFKEKTSTPLKKSKSKKKRRVKEELLEFIKDENCSEESEDNVRLSKFVKRRRKKLKLRPKPKYVKPNPRASFPEDYQCHMSDFEEDDTDCDLTTPRMGEPLNQPFKHHFKHCSECKLKYITDYELEVHYDVVHRTKGDICEHCNKKFINFVGVKAHKHKVHFADCSSVSLFRELCEICGVLTKTLEEHQSVHSDARPFVCHQCGHSSKTKDLLAAHVRAMHTGEKRYGCKYCDKRFSYSADRARHEISSHTKQYKYVCRTCNKGFLKKNFLISHQKTHEGTFLDEM